MWASGMRTFTGNADNKPIDTGVERSSTGGELTYRQTRLVVHAEDGADITQGSRPNHALCTAKVLFGGLKQDPHATVERRFTLFQF